MSTPSPAATWATWVGVRSSLSVTGTLGAGGGGIGEAQQRRVETLLPRFGDTEIMKVLLCRCALQRLGSRAPADRGYTFTTLKRT
jgi:hypothetical protein